MTPAALIAFARLMGGGNDADAENLIAAATPGGVEAQEKRGQLKAAEEQTLPLNGLDKCRAILEKEGFVFGEPALDGEIFQPVTFPKGWRKVPTDHAMWSDLVDDKGRKRGSIFYKAAIYDRSAHMRLDTRYKCTSDYQDGNYDIRKIVVKDADGTILFETPSGAYEETRDNESKCVAWLDEHYPEWRDVSAYWNGGKDVR